MVTEKVNTVPKEYHAINIFISVNNAAKAIEFYKNAFGAEEKSRYEMPDGRIMHAELKMGDSTLQLSDESLDPESYIKSPSTLNATSCLIHLYVDNVDSVFESAIKAGAQVKIKLDNMFWGDRYGQVQDPFGHIWSIATRIENVAPDIIKERAAQMAAHLNEK